MGKYTQYRVSKQVLRLVLSNIPKLICHLNLTSPNYSSLWNKLLWNAVPKLNGTPCGMRNWEPFSLETFARRARRIRFGQFLESLSAREPRSERVSCKTQLFQLASKWKKILVKICWWWLFRILRMHNVASSAACFCFFFGGKKMLLLARSCCSYSASDSMLTTALLLTSFATALNIAAASSSAFASACSTQMKEDFQKSSRDGCCRKSSPFQQCIIWRRKESYWGPGLVKLVMLVNIVTLLTVMTLVTLVTLVTLIKLVTRISKAWRSLNKTHTGSFLYFKLNFLD